MCLAIPLKVKEIKKNKYAIVEGDGHSHKVYLGLLKNVQIGDYIIASHNMALNKISKEEADKILKLVNKSQLCQIKD